jgi:hypothetical protein
MFTGSSDNEKEANVLIIDLHQAAALSKDLTSSYNTLCPLTYLMLFAVCVICQRLISRKDVLPFEEQII